MGHIDAAGVYHKEDIKLSSVVPTKAMGWKQSDHDQQRADYNRDLVKSYLPNGEPNPEFIELYPEESKEIYKFIPTDEEISKEHK